MNKHYKSICPCKDCVPPERHPGCHGKCEKYIEWYAMATGATEAEITERECRGYSRVKSTDILKYMKSRHYRRSRHKS